MEVAVTRNRRKRRRDPDLRKRHNACRGVCNQAQADESAVTARRESPNFIHRVRLAVVAADDSVLAGEPQRSGQTLRPAKPRRPGTSSARLSRTRVVLRADSFEQEADPATNVPFA